ncbi:MAG: magnesium transporter CorA family protein [Polyangiaceae bacterium]
MSTFAATLSPVSSAPVGPTPGKPIAVELDFERKTERRVDLEEARASMEQGRFVWVDIDVSDAVLARESLAKLSLCAEEIVDDALTGEPATQSGRYDDYLHVVVTGCRLRGVHFELERVDVVIGERFLLTMRKGPVVFLDAVRKVYRSDFLRFAKSPSFLVYEIWDHLVENYLRVQKSFEERVEKLQSELIGDVDDRVFARVSELGADLLHFRKVLLPARAVLSDLGSRKSLFISEATQPFLVNMVGTLERVLQDLLADRDILNDSLNLYMSMVGHRTNRVMNRLTVVSVIFLPLTFLCGVYGMNFEVLPEVHWRYGYVFFWGSVVVIVAALGFFMRRARLL